MIRTLVVGAITLLVAACATDPAKIAITPLSDKGLIVIATEPTFGEYSINLAGYDKGEQKLGANFADFDVTETGGRSYFVAEAPADTYVFQDVTRQRAWAVCFHDNSLSFDLKAGEVVYLGVLDPNVHINQLTLLAISSGKLTARSSTIHHFLENITPPAMTPASEADLPAVREFLAKTSPLVTAPVRAAPLSPARFGAGRDLFGLQASCGGWYAGSAAEKK